MYIALKKLVLLMCVFKCMCGVCVGYVWGMCGVCVGCVWGMCGACVWENG